MKVWTRRLVVLLLFAALVVALLWFQGIVLRKEHPTTEVPAAPRVAAGDRTARVERRTLPTVQVYPGFVEAVDPADIAPRVMAAILDIGGREGDPVAAGAKVVTLDDRDARARLSQARAALDAAGARALEARLAFDRAERLHAADALTTQEWESARAAQDGARAQEERAREAVAEAGTALSWYALTAPFDGRILARHADPGQLAMPGRPVLSVYRSEDLRFRVAVPEELARELSTGSMLPLDFDPLPARTAELVRILPPADPDTGTVMLHLSLAPAEDLRPGLLGRLQLSVGERSALVVPASAIERIGQIERVQLVRDGRYVAATVRTGKTHADVVEILNGLAEGEEVRLP